MNLSKTKFISSIEICHLKLYDQGVGKENLKISQAWNLVVHIL